MRHASFFDLKAFRKGNKKWGMPHSGISHAYFWINYYLGMFLHSHFLMAH